MIGQELAISSAMVSRAVSKPIDITGGSYRREPIDENLLSRSRGNDKQKPVHRVRPVIKKPESVKNTTITSSIQHTSENKENMSANKMPMIYNLYANPSPSTHPDLRFNRYDTVCQCGSIDCLAPTTSSIGHNGTVCWDTDDESDDSDFMDGLPAGFKSVGDIIGYANVVRSQRKEALSKLDLAMLHLQSLRRDMRTTR